MHEAAYSQAALPAPARVLGLNLKPFSLGHELFLIREQNPLSVALGNNNVGALVAALPAAALFCSQSFEEIHAMNSDRWIGLKMKLWNRRLKRFNFGKELAIFLEYRSRGTMQFPSEAPTNEKGRPFGAPLLLSLHQFIRRGTRTDAEAWNYPYGLAMMHYGAWLESEGRLKIKNAYEAEHDRAFEEWEKANPGSTLEALDA
jgi:hypothetical protein